MTILILGLVLFLGLHSTQIFAPQARQAFIVQRGENAFKALYSLGSLVGFGLIIWGYSLARQAPVVVWQPPVALKHASALITLAAMILLAGSYGRTNWFKAKLRHPMVLGTKSWALAHLLANGTLASIVLFGSFLVWAVLCFRASRQRDRKMHIRYADPTLPATLVSVVIGIALWALFAFWAHGALIGVRPFG
jgi:uncharacterized membrane protein